MAFVNNTELLEELLASHENGGLTENCFKLFDSICKQRIFVMLKHNRALHYDLMLSKCMDKLILVWKSYKFDQDNAFAYFVSVVDNAIKRYFIDNAMELEMVSLDGSNMPMDSDQS
jgi:hypothetical protein